MALLFLAACSDIGDRDNPLDPGAENYAGLIMSSDSFPISSSAETPSSASDCIGDDCFVDVSSSANGDLFENSSSSSIRNVGNSSSSVKSSSSRVSASVLNCGDIWCGSTATDGFSTITATDGTVIGTNWFYYDDESNSGNSYFDWPATVELDASVGYKWEGVVLACNGICGTANLENGYEFPYAGIGIITLDNSTVDISSWGGICVSYESDEQINVAIHPDEAEQEKMQWDDYRFTVPAGSRTIDIPWSKFSQRGYGPSYSITTLLTKVQSIVFAYQDLGTVSTHFNIVGVGKMGTCNENYSLDRESVKSSSSVEPPSSSSKDEPKSSSSEIPVTSSETPTQSSSSVEPSSSSSEVSPPPSSSSKDEPKSSSSEPTWTCGDSTLIHGDYEYATVVINEQCWTKENMRHETSSGTTLCYGNVAANCETYGRLYNNEAAKNACPTGWRLPTKAEYEALADYSGADMYDAGAHFKANSGWTVESGDDLLEFTALPGGKCNEEQECSKMGTSGYWWTSTEKVKNSSHFALYLNGDNSAFTAQNIMENDQYISVRCVKK